MTHSTAQLTDSHDKQKKLDDERQERQSQVDVALSTHSDTPAIALMRKQMRSDIKATAPGNSVERLRIARRWLTAIRDQKLREVQSS